MSKYSLRPYKSGKLDLKDVYKIFLPSKLYVSLRANAKELWTLEDEQGQTVAIGRVSQAQEDVQNKVMQVGQEFKDLFNLNFTDGYILKRAENPARIAHEVTVVEEKTASDLELLKPGSQDYGAWQMALYMTLLDRLITPGLYLEHLESYKGQRSFKVKSILTVGDVSVREQPLDIHTIAKTCLIKIEAPSDGSIASESFRINREGIFGLDEQLDELDDLLQSFHMDSWDQSEANCQGILITGRSDTDKPLIMSRISELSWRHVYTVAEANLGKSPIAHLSKLAEDALTKEPCLIQIPDLDHYLEEIGWTMEKALETMFSIVKDRRVVIVANKGDSKLPENLVRWFEESTQLTIPDENARREMVLQTLQTHGKESAEADLNATIISQRTPGYTSTNVVALVRKAIRYAKWRSDHERKVRDSQTHDGPEALNISPTLEDLEKARLQIGATITRDDQTLQHRKVRWADIGGQEDTKRMVEELFEWPLNYPEKFQALGIKPGKGLLLYGPPGCSKTMTALALATEAKLNFIAIKGPELLTKYVGESEQNLRNVFIRARNAAPCVIFFDEIDAIGSSGGLTSDSSGGGGVNLVSTLLNELDGVHELRGVSVLAATNKPWDIDSALLRPGRLDGVVYVGLPDANARREIFKITLAGMSHDAAGIDLDVLVQGTAGCSGAEIVDLCRSAGIGAMREQLHQPTIVVEAKHFENAMLVLRRDITPDMVALYDAFANRSRRG